MAISYSDLDINLNIIKKTADIQRHVNTSAIRNSVRNILTTRKMERRMLPEFGASLEQLLFEPMDEITAKKIGEIILQELTFWEPRIRIVGITVIGDEERSLYDITVIYDIQDQTISRETINFVLTS